MVDEHFRPPVTFTINSADYSNALRLQMRRYWATRLGPRLVIVAVVCAAVLAALLSRFHPVWTGGSIGAVLGAVAVPSAYYYFFLPRHARKIYSQQKTAQYPVTASWDIDGYFASTAGVSGKTPWDDYHGWSADASMILLMHSENLFQMIPRRALKPNEVEDLISLLDASGLKRI